MLSVTKRDQKISGPIKKTLYINSFFVRSIVSTISFVVSLIVANYTLQLSGTKYLFLLPFFYGLLFLILPNLWNYSKGNIGMSILNIVIFTRYVVAPFFNALSINMPNIRGVIPSTNGMHYGLIIMIIELFTTFFIVQIFARRMYNVNDYRTNSFQSFKPFKSKFVLYSILSLSIGLLIVFPQIRERYNFFIVTDTISKISLDLPFSGFIILIADLFFIVFPIVMLDFFKKKYENNKRFRYVFYSLISILPSITFFKGTSRFSVIIPTVAFLVILIKLYPKYKNRLITSIGIVLLIVFLSVTLYKQFGYVQGKEFEASLDVNEVSYNFDAYMSGPDNMGRVVDLEQTHGTNITSETLKNDILNNVAILSTFADSNDTTSSWFNYHLYGHTRTADQIVPLSGQSYLHFGPIGTPLFLIITLIIMMYFDSRIRHENRIEYVYLYVYITMYSSMAMMVSFGSIYPIFTNIFLPIWFIFYLNRKIKLK